MTTSSMATNYIILCPTISRPNKPLNPTLHASNDLSIDYYVYRLFNDQIAWFFYTLFLDPMFALRIR